MGAAAAAAVGATGAAFGVCAVDLGKGSFLIFPAPEAAPAVGLAGVRGGVGKATGVAEGSAAEGVFAFASRLAAGVDVAAGGLTLGFSGGFKSSKYKTCGLITVGPLLATVFGVSSLGVSWEAGCWAGA